MFLLSIQIFRSNLNENGSDPAQRVAVLDLVPERCFTILVLQDARVILTEALLEIFSSDVTAARHAAHELNVLYYILKIIRGRKISLKKPKQTNKKNENKNKQKNPPTQYQNQCCKPEGGRSL